MVSRPVPKEASSGPTPLTAAFAGFRPALLTVIAFSAFCNVLLFVGPLYMMQVYDRVLTSRNTSTLVALTLIAIFLILAYAALDALRSRLLVRAGSVLDSGLGEPVFRSALSASLAHRSSGPAGALRDIDQIREFWTGPGVITLCDAPFAPVFVAVCFLFHPYLGALALTGAAILFLLAVLNEAGTRAPLAKAASASREASQSAALAMMNVEAIRALGMSSAMHNRWSARHDEALRLQAIASDRAASILSLSKFVRQTLQVLILGLGGWLAITGEISPGVMIAASIMMGRALAPVEQSVGQWRSFVAARGAWQRLDDLLRAAPAEPSRTPLPAPAGSLAAQALTIAPAPGARPILRDIAFDVPPGEVLAVVGPSASGKSTLLRALVGLWPPSAGSVRLDGADLRHWDPEALGGHIGYLPQSIELFPGTVAENIARFREGCAEAVIEAARSAGAHQMILDLPDGYDTEIGEQGARLSGGQRQRIALARAMFGSPALLVLDEPSAALDRAGEAALLNAIAGAKTRGAIVVLATHTPALLAAADRILALKDGTQHLYGDARNVLQELVKPQSAGHRGGDKARAHHGERSRSPVVGEAATADASAASRTTAASAPLNRTTTAARRPVSIEDAT